jgi:uncharacterized tellurite resistance protein B-like protein
MAKAGFGKGLRDRLQGAVETTRDAVGEAVSSTRQAVESVDLAGVKDRLQEAGGAVAETVKKAGSHIRQGGDAAADDEEGSGAAPGIVAISTRNAIKVIYYLMAVDGTICHGEEDKFDSIGSELDPRFADSRALIVAECQSQLEGATDEDDRYDVLQEGVDDALVDAGRGTDAFVTPRLLVWDLLTVAYSDGGYDETERRLVRHIVRKTGIDNAVFLEMESSILTLMDVERELAWIKGTDRPYLTIEAMVNELADRRNVIFESVKDLIAL